MLAILITFSLVWQGTHVISLLTMNALSATFKLMELGQISVKENAAKVCFAILLSPVGARRSPYSVLIPSHAFLNKSHIYSHR